MKSNPTLLSLFPFYSAELSEQHLVFHFFVFSCWSWCYFFRTNAYKCVLFPFQITLAVLSQRRQMVNSKRHAVSPCSGNTMNKVKDQRLRNSLYIFLCRQQPRPSVSWLRTRCSIKVSQRWKFHMWVKREKETGIT